MLQKGLLKAKIIGTVLHRAFSTRLLFNEAFNKKAFYKHDAPTFVRQCNDFILDAEYAFEDMEDIYTKIDKLGWESEEEKEYWAEFTRGDKTSSKKATLSHLFNVWISHAKKRNIPEDDAKERLEKAIKLFHDREAKTLYLDALEAA